MSSKQRKFVFGLILFLQICLISCDTESDCNQKTKLNIVIIGAGTSGLVSARHSIAHGHDVTVYEQNAELGGIWVYTDEVDKNQYGVGIHSPMYKGLRTNVPYQMMELPGLNYPNDTNPFPPHSDVLKYLHSYADRFDVNKHIKFNHLVVRVLPIENDKWEIIVKDLSNDKFITNVYDAVFVCNGHFSARFSPKFEGAKDYKGKMIHSHEFRTAEAFRDGNVLVIGMGPSGIDLAIHLLNVAKSVTVSLSDRTTNESRKKHFSKISPKLIIKDRVKQFIADGAEFIDGSKGSYTTVILATGYNHSYSFLSVDSGIHVEDNFVQPLYRQVINIHHPKMAFIGIQKNIVLYHLYDLQAQFALKFFAGEEKLPSEAEMLKEYYDSDRQAQLNWSLKKQNVEEFVSTQRQYFNQLSELADIEIVPEVFDSMTTVAAADFIKYPVQFRNYKFTVIDNKHFTKEWNGE